MTEKKNMAMVACVMLGLAALSADAATLHVSPQGNNAWPGALAKPNAAGTDGPLASPVAARDAIRKLKAKGPLTEPVTVVIADGVYELAETFMLTPEDSGTEKCPVTYVAASGAKPVISGGSPITGWKKGDGPVWTTTVPGVKEGEWYFHQLFINGRRATRARTPNVGYLRSNGPIEPLKDRGAARKDPGTKIGFRYNPGDIVPWEDLDEVNVFAYHSWTSSLHWIKEIDEAEHIVRFTAPSSWPMSYWEKKERYHIENYRKALDEAGEWYLEPSSGVLFYWPLEGEDMAAAHAVAPRIGVLLRAEGDPGAGQFVQYVNLNGISFEHADWLMDKNVTNDGQGAAFQRDATVLLRGARHFNLDQCTIAHVGTYALWFREGSQDNRVLQCHLHDLGTGGIRIGEGATAKDEAHAVERILVENSWINDGGHVFPAGHGIWIGRSSYNTLRHCEISDLYYTGVAIGWSWGYAPSTAHHNVVEFCHIHNIGKGVLSDMGTIYTLGLAPGTRLTNNLMHDVWSYGYGGWGLYNDEGSTGVVMENNVVYNTKGGGYHQHYGKENILRNNILAFAKEGQVIRSRQEEHISFIFERNIVLVDNGLPLGKSWTNNQFKLDHNLYWDVNGEPMDFGPSNFEDWQAEGHDTHSVVADPLFVDAAHYDFRLKPESPAYKLGFKDIDLSKVGLYGAAEWVDGPKQVTRKPVDISLTQPPSARTPRTVNDDFEGVEPGERPKTGSVSLSGGGLLAVTDETAAVGKHSLKFVDAKGLGSSWHPHLNYRFNARDGSITNSMYVRTEKGSHLSMEWRDWRSTPYKTGPNFAVTPEGRLTAHGTALMDFPAGQWAKIEIVCVIGKEMPHTFTMTVTCAGQDPRVFKDLPITNEKFRYMNWLGFSGNGTDDGVFYVDEIRLNPTK